MNKNNNKSGLRPQKERNERSKLDGFTMTIEDLNGKVTYNGKKLAKESQK